MDLPVVVSPACQPLPLSPLALGGGTESHGLDGWDAEDFDFEELFRDAEEMGPGTNSSDGNQATAASAAAGSPIDMSDIDLSLKAEWLERDVLSLAKEAPITAAVEPTTGRTSPPAAAEVGNHTVGEGDISAGMAAARTATNTTTWSTTSASEESDDGGSSCIMGGGVSPTLSNDSASSSFQAPRSTVGSEANNPAAATASNNSKRLLAVSSGMGTPILPLAFAPGFSGASNTSAAAAAALSAFPALNFSGFQAAAGQALKRLRGGDATVGAAVGQPCAGGGAAAATPTRLLSGGEDGTGRITKRAKREERLMKNREAANRSRVKVCYMCYRQHDMSALTPVNRRTNGETLNVLYCG